MLVKEMRSTINSRANEISNFKNTNDHLKEYIKSLEKEEI